MRIVLIGCSKTKRKYIHDTRRGGRVLPREVYSSPLFSKRVEYAEHRWLPWMVLSAAFGLWPSNVEKNPVKCDRAFEEIGPYDVTMEDLSPAERAAWITSVAHDIVEQLWETYHRKESEVPLEPNQLTVEIHAGEAYARPLADILRLVGMKAELPCAGLGIGEQLALYTSGALSWTKVPA